MSGDPAVDSLNSSYCINSHNVMLANQCKDLGIIFTSNLNWNSHIEMIISRAYKILGLLRRTFHTSCTNTKQQLYLSPVRSQLMYCSQLWRPNLIKDISCLECEQCRATKYILNNFSSDYKTHLLKLNLLPLMYIYELNDILFLSSLANHLPLTSTSTITLPFPTPQLDPQNIPSYHTSNVFLTVLDTFIFVDFQSCGMPFPTLM